MKIMLRKEHSHLMEGNRIVYMGRNCIVSIRQSLGFGGLSFHCSTNTEILNW